MESSPHRPGQADPAGRLAAILDAIPAGDAAGARRIGEALVRAGPRAIEALAGAAGAFGDPEGIKPKYALHALAVHAARPGAESERRMVASTLARLLAGGAPAEGKAFLCRQLQLCGGAEEIPALGRLLTDARLCEPATQALLAIGGAKAAAVLREALARTRGKPRATVIQALGRLRDEASAPALREAAKDPGRDVRLAALHALAAIGDPEAAGILLKAASVEARYERSQAADACLRLGRRLAARGRVPDAERVFRRLLASRRAPGEVHVRCAALRGLAEALGARAVREVLSAMRSDDARLRHPACRTALALARALRRERPAEVEKLLAGILESTDEGSVLGEARGLLRELRGRRA